MVLPSYTSCTPSKKTALSFAKEKKDKTGGIHVLHIELKPEDRYTQISHLATQPLQHEGILPRNTTINITHTTQHGNVTVHHAVVHNQEKN